MLIILEGCDGAGKSTLADQLRRMGWQTIHHGSYTGYTGQDISRALISSMRSAFDGADLVLDRCWLSDSIYSPVYRGHESRISKLHTRMLERVALQLEAVVVHCRPPYENCARAFTSGREEMLTSTEQLRAVYDGYASMSTELPVVTYDYTSSSVDELLKQVESVEYPNAEVILLSDRANPTSRAQDRYQVPFVSFTGMGCSEWLAAQLDSAGIPESKLCWFNAYTSIGEPIDPSTLPNLPVVALGRNAIEWCLKNKIGHRPCPHPQVHKRFHSKYPYPLMQTLKEILSA